MPEARGGAGNSMLEPAAAAGVEAVAMTITPTDYEKPGVFFLGREYDPAAAAPVDELVLYDSKDLVTHGVVLGMTGSGKTGLCVALLEEAAIDHIPALVIDPKGDIGNLMLTFPGLRAEDFRPWINEDDAGKKGLTPDAYAAKTAETWRGGLAEWGQGPERIATLRERAEVVIYTPGSRAGIPVSILSSLDAPPFEVLDDAELLGERIESTVSSLLALVGVDADPIQSHPAVLLANVFGHEWRAGRGLTLESLIRLIQQPPFDKLGVLDVESFLPAKERQALALRLNNLLASPGFATWLEGVPLDIARILHTAAGKPRIAVFSIAHLNDAERMFFTSLLFNQLLGWMRGQPGTTSLRALCYMDEIFGFLPPTANPPSKKPLLTMLKQGRAFGLGMLLATQNPVDLDYKALSNIGTWFLGRLQTERDKLRVLDGLEGAAGTQAPGFDRAAIERLLSGLGNRVFLMHNVHEDGPVLFQVRWAMSYLRGPLTRTQIKQLTDPLRAAAAPAATPTAATAAAAAANPMALPAAAAPPAPGAGARPAVGHGVVERFAPAAGPEAPLYRPALLRAATVHFASAKAGIEGSRSVRTVHPLTASGVDWDHQLPPPIGALADEPAPGARFADLPGFAMNADNYRQVAKDFADWLYHNERAEVLGCPALKEHARFGEGEGEFRARLAHTAREARDAAVAALRAGLERKLRTLEGRLRTAEGTLARQKAESQSAKVQAGISVLGGLLGGLLGRKSRFSTRSAGSSFSRATSAYKQHQDVGVAADKVDALKEEMARLEQEAAAAAEQINADYETGALTLETTTLKPTRTGIQVDEVALLWVPDPR